MKKNVITKVKEVVNPIVGYYKLLPVWGKVILIVVFLFVNFCLPNVIFMPILQQAIAKRMAKIEAAASKED